MSELDRPTPVEAGSLITCPDCHRAIARTTRWLAFGDSLAADAFEWSEGVTYSTGDLANCECGGNWLRPLMIYGADAENVHPPTGVAL